MLMQVGGLRQDFEDVELNSVSLAITGSVRTVATGVTEVLLGPIRHVRLGS
jgi:hypothetical protein